MKTILESFDELKGQVLTDIKNTGTEIIFTLENGNVCQLYHNQDCCESVTVDDVIGDLTDLLNSPILEAEEATSQEEQPWEKETEFSRESFTWTFYKLATIKGAVTIRFYGESNGYYSEGVDFVQL